MAAIVVNSGKKYITENLKNNVPSNITRFILANVSHSSPDKAVNPDEIIPDKQDIVYDKPVTRVAKMDDDAVVFSLLLLSDVGNFDFNWIGLATSDNTLIACVYVPLQHKTKYSQTRNGNTLTRNIVLKFANAADALNVNISPQTWQFDISDQVSTELDKITKVNFISSSESAIQMSRVNVFTEHASVKLPVIANGTTFTSSVLNWVNLNTGICEFIAPESEKINHQGHLVPSVKFMRTNLEFRFIRANGVWYV